MSLFEDTNPRALKELLGQVHSNESVLPDFQRDFVWDPNATQELIVSIASNYPAGSLLRVRNTHNLFACREFQGASPLGNRRSTYLVLDGQQRLTSLYQAFYGVGDHRYYLNLRKLLDGNDFEECIFHLRANVKKAKHYENRGAQASELILPLGVLKGGAGDFGRWSREVARSVQAEGERNKLEDALSDIDERWIRTIDDYHFPVVTLSDETNAEAICTIFETLNRTGVKLSPFELLTARFYPKGVNLRQLWSAAKDAHPVIADFEIDPYYALQVVSLIARSAPSCKRKDVLDLKASAIENLWEQAIRGLAKGLEMLRDDCGVIVPHWLPYNTIVIPLAAVMAKVSGVVGPEAGAHRDKVRRWFWCSVFGQTYENAPNSQSAKDVIELLEWLDGGEEPETVSSFRFDPRALRDTTPRQRAVYRGTIALVLSRSPRDFHNGAKLTGDLIIEHNVDDHHVFPNAHLGRAGVPNKLRDCVLNRTLIDRKTNIRISDHAPAEYLKDIEAAMGNTKLVQLLESHLLPAGSDSPLWRNDFEAFLDERQEALWGEIKSVTGATGATDLIADQESESVGSDGGDDDVNAQYSTH